MKISFSSFLRQISRHKVFRHFWPKIFPKISKKFHKNIRKIVWSDQELIFLGKHFLSSAPGDLSVSDIYFLERLQIERVQAN